MTHRFLTTAVLALTAASACNCSHGGANTPPPAQAPKVATAQPVGSAAPTGPTVAMPAIPAADPREAAIAGAVSQLLQTQHLTARPIDDDLATKVLDFYIEHLDPGKQFLLKPQVAALRAMAPVLDDQLAAGDLQLARLGTALLTQQRNKVATMVATLTASPFDFTDAESFEADPEKRDFVDTDDALRELWRKNLERQVLERMDRMREASKAETEAKTKTKTEAETEAKTKGKKTGLDKTKAAATEPAPPTATEGKPAEPLPTTDEGREEKARAELADALAGRFQRYATAAPLEAIETFLNAVTAVFGPHTLFMAPDDKANFDIQMTGSLEGIGAVLTEADHFIEVREVVPGGAAWRQGELEAGDLILSVSQLDAEPVDVADMRIGEVVKMIRGPKGTLVTLSVRKPDGRQMSIVIRRDVIVVEATYARGALLKQKPQDAPVGYIYLPSFYGDTRGGHGVGRNATDDVHALLQQFQKRKVDTVVLDLRGNGGGLLSEATDIVGLFIKEGPVVQVGRGDGEVEVLGDSDPEIAFGGRLLILVDRLSASASEIVAGALQDYHRALVVGTGPTHGKGTVQMLIDLNRIVPRSSGPLGVLKLTTQQFFLVDGESTQLRGVQPDVLLPDPLSYLEAGERFLDNPVPWKKIATLPHEDWTGPGWNVAQLTASGQARTEHSAFFDRVRARGKYLEERREDTVLPLQLDAWTARAQAQEAALKAFEPEDKDEPALLTAVPVNYRPAHRTAEAEASAQAAAAERIEKWQEQLEHDHWVEQALLLVRDAKGTTSTSAAP